MAVLGWINATRLKTTGAIDPTPVTLKSIEEL
jgi:hypothetical protein